MLLIRTSLCTLAALLAMAVSLSGRETRVSNGGGDYSLRWHEANKRWDGMGGQTLHRGMVKVRRGSLFKRRAARMKGAMGVSNTAAHSSESRSLRSRGGPLKLRLWKRDRSEGTGSGFEAKVVRKKRFKFSRNEEFGSRGSSELSLQKLNKFAFRRTHSSQPGIPVKRVEARRGEGKRD